ncbi:MULTISPECIES: hypothetical protein [Pseudofrankia]|uniref:hypothetical protein n=1 Tax=Pseudofrankia TaxID=2994363 RepID=UPI000234CDA4|nr:MULTISPECIES: hypothetical protein [Pseudofrankia]OHV37698.1 hypothetical protein BCD49_03595 [Pseudofrankia sp. EUN1h]
MVTVRRRSFGALWAVALLVIGLLSAGGGGGGAGAGASDRALAAVSSVAGSAARADVVVPRVDGRMAVSAKLAPDHPGDLAVAATLFGLTLPGLVWWRRAVGRGRRPDKLDGVCGARGPPAR